jgi:chromosome segregation ATPase
LASYFSFAEKVASQSESVDHFRTSMEAQLESNREFHARQVKRLREQIEAKNGQVETLRAKNSEAHAESDRIKSEYAMLQKHAVVKESKLKEMETKHEQTNQAKNDLRGLEETGMFFLSRISLTIISWTRTSNSSQPEKNVRQRLARAS